MIQLFNYGLKMTLSALVTVFALLGTLDDALAQEPEQKHIWGYCVATEKGISDFEDLEVILQGVDEQAYRNFMMSPHRACWDHRYTNQPPVQVTLVERLREFSSSWHDCVGVWLIEDYTGGRGITWIICLGEPV